MALDLTSGAKLIIEIRRQHRQDELRDIYYFGQWNALHNNYSSLQAYIDAMMPNGQTGTQSSEQNADEILSGVSEILKSFKGG